MYDTYAAVSVLNGRYTGAPWGLGSEDASLVHRLLCFWPLVSMLTGAEARSLMCLSWAVLVASHFMLVYNRHKLMMLFLSWIISAWSKGSSASTASMRRATSLSIASSRLAWSEGSIRSKRAMSSSMTSDSAHTAGAFIRRPLGVGFERPTRALYQPMHFWAYVSI